MIKTLKELEEFLLKELTTQNIIDKEMRISLLRDRVAKKIPVYDNLVKSGMVDEEKILDLMVQIFNISKNTDEYLSPYNAPSVDQIFEEFGVIIGNIDENEITVYININTLFQPWDKLEKRLLKKVRKVLIKNAVYEKIKTELESAIKYKKNNALSTNEQLKKLPEGEIAIRFANEVLEKCILSNASDIHIEPQKQNFRIRMRLNGVLHVLGEYDLDLFPSITSRLKLMSSLDIAERRDTQDGALLYKMMVNEEALEIPFRVSVMPTIYGEKIVLRKLGNQNVQITMDALGMSGDILQKWKRLIKKPHGIVLVSGPTGSGKSTTLQAAINEIKSDELNITTIEDPVEAKIAGINQIQIDSYKVSFADALRSLLRQDPDIIMIGEIRDQETAEIALRASLTGHLVFSTIHTNNAPSAVTRLVDMGIEPFLVASSVMGVLAQRLVRVLCPHCKKEEMLTEAESLLLNVEPEVKIYKAAGCRKCNNTGYISRMGVYEFMVVDAMIQKLIHNKANDLEIMEYATKHLGMRTIYEEAKKKVLEGVTSLDELMRISAE